MPTLENPPLRPTLITTVASQQQLNERAHDLLEEAVLNLLVPTRSIAEGETLSSQSMVAKSLRSMNLAQQLEFYHQVIQK